MGPVARIEHDEASRAVGRLGREGGDALLPEKRGLLVARQRGDRDRHRYLRAVGRAVYGARGYDFGQHRARDVEQVEQFVVPVEGVDVEEHRARGVRDVGDVEPPARKPPCEPRIDRAETEFAPLGARACAGYVVENPADFGRREVGVENQSRLFADTLRQTAFAQHVAVVGRAAILPHDRVVDGFRRLAVPYDGRLALVGNAQRFDVAPFDIGLVDDVLHDEGLR